MCDVFFSGLLLITGAISLAGVEPGLWNVVGGNYQVPQGLLKKAGANLIKGKVNIETFMGSAQLSFLHCRMEPGQSVLFCLKMFCLCGSGYLIVGYALVIYYRNL